MSCEASPSAQLVGRKPAQGQKPIGHGSILEKITGLGRYTIVMRPHSAPCGHQPEELAGIVANCQVSHRGYEYPHPGSGPYGAARITPTYAESCHDAFGHVSTWRFYCSGLFREHAALAEDVVQAPRRASRRAGNGPPGRYLEPVWTLFAMSEAFAFASNLATDTGREYEVSVSFDGMKDRVLEMCGEMRIEFFRDYVSREDRIDLDPAVVLPDLDTELHGRISLGKTLEVMDRFGWRGSGPRSILEYDQELFFAKVRRP